MKNVVFGQKCWEPGLPLSLQEEEEKDNTFDAEKAKSWGWDAQETNGKDRLRAMSEGGHHFEPPNPVSVQEIDINDYLYECTCELENIDSLPRTVFESKKVFIGKRNHQTEKPVDLMEFFLKYWSDEGDVVLDPTMGSGTMGVACAKLNRKFIGVELNEKIFEVAVKRINNKK